MAQGRSTVDEVIRILADIDPAIRSLEDLRRKIKLVEEEASKIDITTTAGAEQYNRTIQKLTKLEIAEKKITSSTVEMTAAMRRAEGQVKGFGDAAAVSGGFAIALGQTFSDVGQFGFGFAQGIRAIANNVSQLATMFTIAVVQAGGFTKALRSLWATMMGPLGVVVAFQVIIGAIDLWAASQRKAKSESDKLRDSLDDLSSSFIEGSIRISSLKSAYDRLNPSSEQAIKLKAEISKQLKVNIGDYQSLDDAIRAHIRVLQLEAEASSLVKSMTDESTKSYIENQKALRQNEPLYEKIAEAERRRNEAQEGSVEYAAANNEIEKLRQKLLPITIRVSEEYAIKQERLVQIQTELNGLVKESTKVIEKKGKAVKKTKEEYSFLLKTFERYKDLIKQINEESIDSEIGLLDPEMQKIARLENRYEGYYNELEYLRNVDGISEQEYLMRKERLNIAYDNRILALKNESAQKEVKIVKDKNKKEIDLENRKQQAIGQLASNSIGFLMELNQALSGQTEEQRKKAFQRDKALRVAQAVMDTYSAANRALASAPSTPVGFIFAAAAIAAGLANVTRIMSTKFEGGSSGFSNSLGGQQGSYPYPMAGFSNIDPQFPDRTGSLDIKPRQFRIYVTESDITGAQKASVEREMRSSVF